MLKDNTDKFTKIDFFIILIIFFLALIIRLAYMNDYVNTKAYPFLIYSDSYSYFTWAKDIAGGEFLGAKAFMKWPLYAYFLAFWFKVWGSNVSNIYYLQFILGAFNCVLVYFISKNIFNRQVATISGLFYLWYALPVFYEGMFIYTSLSLFLNSLFFLCILKSRQNLSKNKLFGLGVLLGICAIAQANIILFGLLAVPWIIYEKKYRLAKLITNISSFILGLFLVLGITTLSNYLSEKDMVLIAGNTGINFYLGNNPEATGIFYAPRYLMANQEGMFRDARTIAILKAKKDLKTSEVSSFWFRKSLDFIKDQPRSYLRLLKKKINFLFSPLESIHDQEYIYISGNIRVFKVMFNDLRLIFPLCILGMLFGLKNLKKIFLLYLVFFTFALSMLIFFVATRYRIAMVPFMAVFSAYAVFNLSNALNTGKYRNFVLFFLIFFSIFAMFNHDLFSRGETLGLQDWLENYYPRFYMGHYFTK